MTLDILYSTLIHMVEFYSVTERTLVQRFYHQLSCHPKGNLSLAEGMHT